MSQETAKTHRENKAAEYGLIPESSSIYIEDTQSAMSKIDVDLFGDGIEATTLKLKRGIA